MIVYHTLLCHLKKIRITPTTTTLKTLTTRTMSTTDDLLKEYHVIPQKNAFQLSILSVCNQEKENKEKMNGFWYSLRCVGCCLSVRVTLYKTNISKLKVGNCNLRTSLYTAFTEAMPITFSILFCIIRTSLFTTLPK